MIEVVTSKECPFCEKQVKVLAESFRKEDYRVIDAQSKDFESFEMRDMVDGFPYVVIRDSDGIARYSNSGFMDAHEIDSRIQKYSGIERPFNLRKTRQVT